MVKKINEKEIFFKIGIVIFKCVNLRRLIGYLYLECVFFFDSNDVVIFNDR